MSRPRVNAESQLCSLPLPDSSPYRKQTVPPTTRTEPIQSNERRVETAVVTGSRCRKKNRIISEIPSNGRLI